MPPPPSENALKAMALGDNEFLFRHLGRWLEFVGDGGGRVRPLRFYDYDRVVGWMRALDQLDEERSDFIHVIATRYFGEITKAVDVDHRRLRTIIDYLRIVSLQDPARYWNWLVWSAVKARTDIKDPALVAALAHDLQSPELRDPRVPAWVRVLPVRLYRAAGDEAAAKDAEAHISPEDAAAVQAMKDRLKEAIGKLKQTNPLSATPETP